MEQLSLAIYPVVVYLCALVGYRYTLGVMADFKEYGWDRAVAMRIGIVIGFIVGAGVHAALWGVVRWFRWVGYDDTWLTSFALDMAFPLRLAVAIAAMLHLYASTHDSRHLKRDTLMTAGLFLGAFVVTFL